MTGPGRRRHRRAAGALVVAVLCGLAGASTGGPAYAAGAEPPPLPAAGTDCVGASSVSVDQIPWPVARLAPMLAWPLSRGKGVIVAVVDSGVGSPPGLAGAVRPGRDVTSGGRGNSDCLGRGTALAGIAAARLVGRSPVVGMAPEASVLPIRITDDNGQVPRDGLAKGVRAATSLGADVILVGTAVQTNASALRAAVAAAVADDVVVVAPVADGSQDSKGAGYPAAYKQVLAVGGVDVDGTQSEPYTPDLLAPGFGIVAVGGAGHYQVGGPAVAAAYVAGAAALVRAYHPGLDQAEVRQRLTLTAIRSGAAAGVVDPYAAVAGLAPGLATHTPTARHDSVVPPRAPGTDPAVLRSLWLAGALLAATLAVLAAAAVLRSRRRRLTDR
ncbi:MAG: S8 family serine peptidase [Micromonosporaceae bacterium]